MNQLGLRFHAVVGVRPVAGRHGWLIKLSCGDYTGRPQRRGETPPQRGESMHCGLCAVEPSGREVAR